METLFYISNRNTDNNSTNGDSIIVVSATFSPNGESFPKLETLLPRKTIITKIDALIAKFTGILDEKKENRGNDMLTYMLEDVSS